MQIVNPQTKRQLALVGLEETYIPSLLSVVKYHMIFIRKTKWIAVLY